MENIEKKDKSEIVCIKNNESKPLEFNGNNNIPYSNIKKFFAELFGSLFLLFIGSGVGVYTKGDLVPIALANGIILGSLVHLFGPISGGHFNPSITLALFLRKKLNVKELVYYIIAQLIGGFIGSALVGLCNRGKFDRLASNQIAQYLITYNDPNNKKIDAWCYICALICEIILTFLLIILFCALSMHKNYANNNVNVIIVGATLSMFIFTGFHISGGSMNLVRSLPPAVYEALFGNNNTAIKQIWIYIVGPIVGSVLASYTYPHLF